MKISVNGKDIITLTEHQKSCIKNDIPSEIFDIDMKRRLVYWIMDRWFKKGLEQLKVFWLPQLPGRGVTDIPTSDSAMADLILSQPEYANLPSVSASPVLVDDVALFQVPANAKQIIRIAYSKSDPDAFIEEQLAWIMNHKYERCMERFRREWEPKLKREGAQSISLNNEVFANQVRGRQDYKDRSARELDSPHRTPVEDMVADANRLLNSHLNR